MEYITLYHGTDINSASKIIETGLKEGSYLTSLEELAEYYAECAMEETGADDYTTLKIIVPTNILEADTNAFDEPITISYKKLCSSEYDWHNMIENGKIPYPNKDDWKTSLKFTHSVKITNSIHSNISKLY